MPFYEFKCTNCGRRFVDRQTFEEHDEHQSVKCPECNSTQVEQQLSEVFAQTAKKS